MKNVGLLIFVVVSLVLITACEVRMWKECRASNSVTYCLRVLSR